MGFETAVSAPLVQHQRSLMARNFEAANAFLKVVDWDDCEYMPVTCSHTAAAASTIEGDVRGIFPELCTDGKVDNMRVFGRCPSWEKELTERHPMHCLPPGIGGSMSRVARSLGTNREPVA